MSVFQTKPSNPVGDEVVGGDLDGLLDEGGDGRSLAGDSGAGQLALDVDVLDPAVLREDAEGGGVGGELVVGVAEVGVGLVLVERLHGVELALDLVLDLVDHLVGVGRVRARALAEDEEDGALDVVALLERGVGFGGNGPRGGDAEAGGPEDEGEVGPDARVLVREHDDLDAVVGHVGGEVPVAVHHAPAEVLALTDDRERPTAVRGPLREETGEGLLVPGEEELAQLMVVDGVRVGRVCHPHVAVASIRSCVRLRCAGSGSQHAHALGSIRWSVSVREAGGSNHRAC